MLRRIANTLTAVVSITVIMGGIAFLKYVYVTEHLVAR